MFPFFIPLIIARSLSDTLELSHVGTYSNYDYSLVVDGYELLGVQSVDASYGISEKPVRVAGVGFIDATIDSPLQGNFSVNRKMVSNDPLFRKNSTGSYVMDESEMEGAILYDNGSKSFGFTKARVSRYSVSCSVGEIPDIQTDFTVYGSLGKSVANSPASKIHPAIKYPDQASMRISVSDFAVDAISDFSYSRTINTQPVYGLPKGNLSDWNNAQAGTKNLDPMQIDTQYPIETDINFTILADEYEIREIKDRIQAAPKSDVKIEILDAIDSSLINEFEGRNVHLIGESVNGTVEEEMSISLTYKGYETLHNDIS